MATEKEAMERTHELMTGAWGERGSADGEFRFHTADGRVPRIVTMHRMTPGRFLLSSALGLILGLAQWVWERIGGRRRRRRGPSG